jgi:uncharacterized lipoprotein YajG
MKIIFIAAVAVAMLSGCASFPKSSVTVAVPHGAVSVDYSPK